MLKIQAIKAKISYQKISYHGNILHTTNRNLLRLQLSSHILIKGTFHVGSKQHTLKAFLWGLTYIFWGMLRNVIVWLLTKEK